MLKRTGEGRQAQARLARGPDRAPQVGHATHHAWRPRSSRSSTPSVEARLTLRAKGIDTCCGGGLTLEQAAAARGMPAGELLAAVLAAVPPAQRPSPAGEPAAEGIRGSDSVRAVIARYPQTVAVFERAGLLGCGGAAGPEERIDLFASIHRIGVDQLLADLDAASKQPAGPAPAKADDHASTLYRAFLVTGLWSTVTMGASFGAYNLLAIHLALGPVLPAHQWVHAGFQLFGFVFMLVMGVAYHTVPRFLGTELARPAVARATFYLGLAAVLVVSYGRFGSWVPYSVPALLFGALLQLATAAGFAWVLAATFRKAKPPADLFHRYLAAGTLWWLVAAGFLVAAGVTGAINRDTATAVEWHEALYAAALLGGALAWVQGMFLRTGPVFLGPARDARVAGEGVVRGGATGSPPRGGGRRDARERASRPRSPTWALSRSPSRWQRSPRRCARSRSSRPTATCCPATRTSSGWCGSPSRARCSSPRSRRSTPASSCRAARRTASSSTARGTRSRSASSPP